MLIVQSVRIECSDGKVKTSRMNKQIEDEFSVEMVEDLLRRLGVPIDDEGRPYEPPVELEGDAVWFARDADEMVDGVEGRYCYIRLLCSEIKE